MVYLYEVYYKVEEVGQGKFANVPSQFLEHPVKVHLNTLPKRVIAHRHSKSFEGLEGENFGRLCASRFDLIEQACKNQVEATVSRI